MKKILILTLFSAFAITACSTVKETAEDVADQAVGTMINNNEKSGDNSSPDNMQRASVPAEYNFVAGSNTFFTSDMSMTTIGAMPAKWKTSGSGQVVTFPGVQGKWLLMNEFTTYKIDSLLSMPEDFSIEFDIITRSLEVNDLLSFSFGFSHNNSISEYISDAYNGGAITSTTIHYWNKEIINSSSDTEIYNSIDFPLTAYANAIMHVSIEVKGTNMKVYLDKKKVLDTKMFLPDSVTKYFYMSTPTDLTHGAQIAVGNFVFSAY